MSRYSLKKILIAFTLGFSPFCLLMGILSLFGITPVYFNDTPYLGLVGLIISMAIAPLCGLIMGFISYIFLNMGVFLYDRIFKKNIKEG